LFPVMK